MATRPLRRLSAPRYLSIPTHISLAASLPLRLPLPLSLCGASPSDAHDDDVTVVNKRAPLPPADVAFIHPSIRLVLATSTRYPSSSSSSVIVLALCQSAAAVAARTRARARSTSLTLSFAPSRVHATTAQAFCASPRRPQATDRIDHDQRHRIALAALSLSSSWARVCRRRRPTMTPSRRPPPRATPRLRRPPRPPARPRPILSPTRSPSTSTIRSDVRAPRLSLSLLLLA